MLLCRIESHLRHLTGQRNVDGFLHLGFLLYGRKIRQVSY